jgi:hypothetical protein
MNFTGADLVATLAAVCLYPLFVCIPGYVVAWFGNLFDFRRRTLIFRIALSLPLSISLCPIAIYLVGRFVSMHAVWFLYAACWIGFVPLVLWDLRQQHLRLQIDRKWFVFFGIAACWLVLALFSSVDLQLGERDYFPTIAFDYALRTQFVHAITATGIPPDNPYYFPGHSVPLRYHYFWLLFCSLVEQAGGAFVGPRRAWMGGTVWGGFGFLAVVALYLRLVVYRGAASLRRRMLVAFSLVCITGLDIIPTALLWLLRATGMKNAVFLSVEFWNEQVDGFVWTSLWTAHHLAGLIACLTAFLLLSEAVKKLRYALWAGVALASAAGLSIYVGFAFGVFLASWGVVTMLRRWWRETLALAIAGAAGLLLLLPYALALRGPGKSGSPIEVWVRPLHPADFIFQAMQLGRPLIALGNALLLPLNYFLEFGFFFVAAVIWWRTRRKNPAPLSRTELALATMVATSAGVCTFLRSSVIANNDLGWRGFLIAQFVLLLWGVDVLMDSGRPRRALLSGLLILGAAGTTYDVLILRFFPVLADQGITAKFPWMATDPDLGKRNYAGREAFEWTTRATPAGTVIQFNPKVAFQDMPAFLYSARRFAAASQNCMTAFGGDPALCPGMIAKLNMLYSSSPTPLASVCGNLPIDILVAKDTDPAWGDRQGWVWTNQPLYANAYYRVFRCKINH